MKKKLKEKLSFLIFVIMIILGIAIILYPVISNHLSKINYQEIIDNYDFKVAKQKNSYNEQLVNKARKYNSSLTSLNITDVFQNQIGQSSSEYFSVLNVDNNGMMGYISIPKIDIKIPIYHGTSSDILQKGVGHLEGSSIPIGGENTHAVLSAHRGLPSSRLFTDLDQLKVGDTFYIHILDEVLAYRVNQVLVVEPSDIDFLQIVKGKDYVTLVTCTPYAINTHRLLVRGERIEYSAQEEESIAINKKMSIADIVLYTCLIFAVLLIIGSIISITHYQKRKVIDKNIK